MAGRKTIKQNACFFVGNSYDIHPFEDPWIPNWPNGTSVLKTGACTVFIYRVADLINEEGQWNEELLQRIFTRESEQAIMNIKLPSFVCKDTLIWRRNETWIFMVKNNYQTRFKGLLMDDCLTLLWNSNMHERLKMFLWRLKTEVIPMRENIFARTQVGDKNCPVCGIETETTFHLFFECPGIKSLSFGSKWGVSIEK